MQQNHFDVDVPGAGELTEEDLARVQGGNIFGDAWNWVEGKVSDAWNALKKALEQLPREPSPFPRPPFPPVPPQKPPQPTFPRPL